MKKKVSNKQDNSQATANNNNNCDLTHTKMTFYSKLQTDINLSNVQKLALDLF